MEVVKLDRVVSVNSEISGHEAKHLLCPEISVKRSWLCAKGSEKGIVILKMERAALITKIHLGNANSAFIQIAVGHAADVTDFQTLIPTSSFMTANDVRSNQNMNQVRFFSTSDFDPDAVGKKWDLLKVICSQPFNKQTPFGICFIKVHGESSTITPRFSLKPPEDLNLPEGFIFHKKKCEVPGEKSPTISERILGADKPSALAKRTPLIPSSVSVKPSTSKGLRQRDDEDTTDNRKNRNFGLEDEPSPKKSKRNEDETEKKDYEIDKGKKEKTRDSKKAEENVKEKNEKKVEKDGKKKGESGGKVKMAERFSQNPKPARTMGKPFNRLMENVVFVLSGYQNPERATYRSHALEMGAKYRPDWIDKDCTHLVAAYINTPKCNQVKGKGKIVSKDWIEKCYEDKKRYPWRRFALDKKDQRQPESEEEIDVEETQPTVVDPSPSTSSYLYGSGSRESPSSLDEEKKDVDLYDAPTDDEDCNTVPEIPELPNFFKGMTFYVDENITDRRVLERYITAYNGVVCEKLNNDVAYFITSQRGTLLDVLKKTAKNFKAVSPTWIQSVNCSGKFLPADNFSVE